MKFLAIAGCVLCLRLLLVVPAGAWGSERVGIYLSHTADNSYGFTNITYALGIIAVFFFAEKSAIKNANLRYTLIIIFSLFSLMSGSKKQIFFLMVSIIIYAILKSKTPAKLIKNMVVVSVALVVICILLLKVDVLYNIVGERLLAFLSYSFSDISVDTDLSTIHRNLYLSEAWRVFAEHPVFGVGLDCFRYFNAYTECWAENNFLELLADAGALGALLYYLVNFHILVRALKRIHLRNDLDIQIVIVSACILIVDLSMVSYSSNTLQLHLAFLYASNTIAKKAGKRT